jgi:hypothetical protein
MTADQCDEERCPKCGSWNVSPYVCKDHGDCRIARHPDCPQTHLHVIKDCPYCKELYARSSKTSDDSLVSDAELARIIDWCRNYLLRKQSIPLPIPSSEVREHNFAIDLWSSITCALLELKQYRANCTGRHGSQSQCVERLALETTKPQAPIARVTIAEHGLACTTLYAPGLPPGDHDLYCQPEAVAPYMRAETVTEKRAYHETHEAPHCPTCYCGEYTDVPAEKAPVAHSKSQQKRFAAQGAPVKAKVGCMACGGLGYIDEPSNPCDCVSVKTNEQRAALDARLAGRPRKPVDLDEVGIPHLDETPPAPRGACQHSRLGAQCTLRWLHRTVSGNDVYRCTGCPDRFEMTGSTALNGKARLVEGYCCCPKSGTPHERTLQCDV